MVKTIKLKKTDYRSAAEMMFHCRELTEEFKKQTNDLVVEVTYRYGELDHIFILINWKKNSGKDLNTVIV